MLNLMLESAMLMLRKNWSWILVGLIAVFPLVKIFSLISFNFEYPEYDLILFDDYELSEKEALQMGKDIIPGI
jgi:sulfoxide reductase heme-binding subunit YedZ